MCGGVSSRHHLCSLVGLLVCLLCVFSPLSSPHLSLSLLGGVTHKLCYDARWRNCQPNPKCKLGNRPKSGQRDDLHCSFCPCGLVVHNRVPAGKLSKSQQLGELLLSKCKKRKSWVPCPCCKVGRDATKQEKKKSSRALSIHIDLLFS